MYYVFFDIDGVLTSERQSLAQGKRETWNKFDPVAIEFFNRIFYTYKDVRFVCISTWKNSLYKNREPQTGWISEDHTSSYMIEHWVITALRNAGFRGDLANIWKTEDEHLRNRAKGIADYLKEYPATDFIIFDDNDYNFNDVIGKSRWVQTHPQDGLLTRHMRNALSICGVWEKR